MSQGGWGGIVDAPEVMRLGLPLRFCPRHPFADDPLTMPESVYYVPARSSPQFFELSRRISIGAMGVTKRGEMPYTVEGIVTAGGRCYMIPLRQNRAVRWPILARDYLR